MTNEQIIAEFTSRQCKEVMPMILAAVDARQDREGHITFCDVREAVAMFVNNDKFPALFQACKRLVECERCITIF